RQGKVAAAIAANAANGVAQANAKLASAQEVTSSPKHNSGAWRGSTGCRRTAAGEDMLLKTMDDLLAANSSAFPRIGTEQGQMRSPPLRHDMAEYAIASQSSPMHQLTARTSFFFTNTAATERTTEPIM